MSSQQFIERLLIVGGIFAYRRVGAAAGFDAENAVLRQGPSSRQKLCVFLGKDVVGHDGQAIAVAQFPAERFNQCSLAGADRPAYADHRNVFGAGCCHAATSTMMFIRSMHDPSKAEPCYDLNRRDSN